MTKTKWHVKAIYLVVAVALVLGFTLMPAMPTQAAFGTYAGYTFGNNNNGTATWSTAAAHSGTYSVLLNAPVSSVSSVSDYARVKIPITSAPFSTFAAPSFYYKIDSTAVATVADIGATWPMLVKSADTVATGFLSPYPMLEIDDGTTPATLIGQAWASSTKVDWTQWLNATASKAHTEALWHDGFNTNPALGGTIPACYAPLSWWQTNASSPYKTGYNVLSVRVGLGLFAANCDAQIAYVDDVIISGTTYDLQPIAIEKPCYNTGQLVNFKVCKGNSTGIMPVYAYSPTVGGEAGKITLAASASPAGVFNSSFTVVGTTPGTGQLLVNNGDLVTVKVYSFNWYDSGGTAVNITDTCTVDDTAPVVNITTPADAAKVKGTVAINGTIADAHTYSAVLNVDGVQKATSTISPITFSWITTTGYPDGSHTVLVQVTDCAGNVGTHSHTVTVDNTKPVISNQVATPPTVKPAASGGVTPIVFTATVTDPTSGVATVTIDCSSLIPAGGPTLTMYDDGTHGDVTAGNGTYTLAYVNNLTTEGNYTLPVNATDNAGNTAIAESIALGVWTDTTAPVISGAAIAYPFGLSSARSGDTVTISATVTDDSGTVTGVKATCAGLTGSPVDLTKGTGNTWSVDATVASTTTQIDISAWDAKNNTSHDTSLSLVVDPDITGYVINLNPGWNFISLPLIPGVPENTDIASVLLGVGNIAHVTRVDYYYNTGTSTGWQTYMPGAGGTLATMEDGKGYWMWMSAADKLTVKGRIMPAAPALPHTYPVYGGWNAIGFKSLTAKENQLYLAGLTYTVLWEYNTATGYALIYPPATTDMNVGHGYWLWLATASGTIVPP